jgi:UDP-N-acetylmuramoylalanine--D-glutamate ligase
MPAVSSRPALPAGPVLVVGLARSGVAAALALRDAGIAVSGVDARPVEAAVRQPLEAAGVAVHAPDDGLQRLAGIATVVKSPGVPQSAPVIAAARSRGVRVIGELELGWRLVPNECIAVTGSNGKTTVTELLGHVHRVAGVPVEVAGNVGTALASLAGTIDPSAVVVAECSSFQLEDTEAFAPDAAVLLNVTPDHLDRHGGFEPYARAKLEVLAHQSPDAIAVLPTDLALPGGLRADGGAARRIRFGGEPAADLRDADGHLWWREARLMAVGELALRGPHNRLNAMAVAATALGRGMAFGPVREALATFGGVEHRLEDLGVHAGVRYVNDSKATNVDAAAVGLCSFDGGVHAILGGSGKDADYAPLRGPVSERCRAVYLIGATAPAIRAALEGAGVALHDCGDLERAVAAARALARPGETVLLSPACASFDQYTSYEERGAHFKRLVAAG